MNRDAGWRAQCLAPLQWLLGNRLRVLMYHSISNASGDRWATSPAALAAQLDHLAEQNYRVVSLVRAFELLNAGERLHHTVAITFDDGYRDFLTEAAPRLLQHGFSATVFVVTGRLGQTAAWHSTHPERVLLTGDEVRQVKAMGFTVGSHTVSHPNLTQLADDELTHELRRSREALNEWSEGFAAFAYPGGTFSPRERRFVQAAGYDCALIVGGRWGNGPETDCYRLKREPMMATDTLAWFARRVSGYYEPHYLWARARGIHTR